MQPNTDIANIKDKEMKQASLGNITFGQIATTQIRANSTFNFPHVLLFKFITDTNLTQLDLHKTKADPLQNQQS